MVITSVQNEKVKRLVSLHDKKGRREYGTYLAEGKKLVREAVELGLPIASIAVSEQALPFLQELGAITCPITELSRSVFERVSTECSPEGIMAEIALPEGKTELKGDCLLLDGVADPGNVGALIRTAAAAGYTTVIACNTADAFSPKAVRAAMGGLFRVSICSMSQEDAVCALKQDSYSLIAADMGGEDVFSFKAQGKVCLAVGNEANGLSQTVRAQATHTVKIPMKNGVESLNAAISGSLLMYLLKN